MPRIHSHTFFNITARHIRLRHVISITTSRCLTTAGYIYCNVHVATTPFLLVRVTTARSQHSHVTFDLFGLHTQILFEAGSPFTKQKLSLECLCGPELLHSVRHENAVYHYSFRGISCCRDIGWKEIHNEFFLHVHSKKIGYKSSYLS